MQRRVVPAATSGAARLVALLCFVAALLSAALDRHGHVRCSMDGALHWVACCEVARWADGAAFDDGGCCEHLAQADQSPAAPSLSRLAAPAALPPALAPPAPPWPTRPRALAPLPTAAGPRAPPARAGPDPDPIARRLARLARLLS